MLLVPARPRRFEFHDELELVPPSTACSSLRWMLSGSIGRNSMLRHDVLRWLNEGRFTYEDDDVPEPPVQRRALRDRIEALGEGEKSKAKVNAELADAQGKKKKQLEADLALIENETLRTDLLAYLPPKDFK